MLRRNPTEITLTQQDLLEFSKDLQNKSTKAQDTTRQSIDTPYNAIEANERRRQQQTLEERLGI